MTLACAAELAGIPLAEAEAWADARDGKDRGDATLRAVAFEALAISMDEFVGVLRQKEPSEMSYKEHLARTDQRLIAASQLSRIAVALARMTARPKPGARGTGKGGEGEEDLFDKDPWTD